MSKRKSIGSYYTPEYLAKFTVQYLLPELTPSTEPINFLEPSAGDGVFVSAFLDSFLASPSANSIRVRTIERELPESEKIKHLVSHPDYNNVAVDCITDDFLEVQRHLKPVYRVICGNPPYLNKKRLTKDQIGICAEINSDSNLPTFVNNIWTAFVLRSAQLLTPDGVMAFVLPAEILQVKYAVAVREYLYKCFDRIEIFDFKELLFDAKGQGTILFIGFKETKKKAGVYFTNVTDIKALESNNFNFKRLDSVIVDGFRVKESHYNLPADDVALLYLIRRELNALNDYISSKPGVVTAANDFFIVNEEIKQLFDLQLYSRPIIQKGSFVNGKVEFTREDFDKLSSDGAPTYLLDFNKHAEPINKTKLYLYEGEERKINERYKCSLRERWYDIPNVSTPGKALFFKRCHIYPKLIKNTAEVLVTDSAYKVEMKAEYDLNSFIFSFYNSLTLAFAELEGRHYGGGVLELTPSEFKQLPIVYTEVEGLFFDQYANSFKKKSSIEEVLEANDEIILRKIPGIDDELISRIKYIRQQLVNKRMRR